MDEVRLSPGADGALEVALAGEIDYLNAPALAERIRSAVADLRPSRVLVDLSAVTFLDSSGLGVLVAAYRAATAAQAGFQVVGPRPVVFEQLQMAGLVDLFAIDAPNDARAPIASADLP